MPGKVKVKILAGRNLPVMDRGSDTTDAYVEIKFNSITHKTDVCRKSLNPQWNSDWYRFDVDDADLQDEPLQIRIMDHDTYSANDAIGKVNISLNPLLLPTLMDTTTGTTKHSGKGSVMSGWIPVFDTMHGIRGEVNLIVKVDLFSDSNKFRQSSCGVQFFHSSNVPHGYSAQVIHGFVEELVVNDDPEYQWIDKIRTPRASNEARQVVFLKLSGQVQRKIGLKAIDLGANAVIGYTQCFDLEGDVGVVARGIGTAVTLIKIPDNPLLSIVDNTVVEENETASATPSPNKLITTTTQQHPLSITTQFHARTESTGGRMSQSPAKINIPNSKAEISLTGSASGNNGIFRRSSDSDLSVTPKGNSLTSGERVSAIMRTNILHVKQPMNQENLDMLEYPFLTLSKYPSDFILHLGATVAARSVKLLERVPNPDEPETRDSWWTELRMEIRSHARALGCNVVIGYSEVTTISDEVCVLSATGTAAVINFQYTGEHAITSLMTSSLDRQEFDYDFKEGVKDIKLNGTTKNDANNKNENTEPEIRTTPTPQINKDGNLNSSFHGKPHKIQNCTICHVPYNQASVPFLVNMKRCSICKRGKVPDVILATIEIPDGLQLTGRGCLLQAQVCRTKRDLRSELNAREISDGLPFLEYELHRLLINKLKVKGMNAIFGLKAYVAIGERMIALMATGTAVYVTSLPPAVVPKIVAGNSWSDMEKLADLQKALVETFERNCLIYQLKPNSIIPEVETNGTSTKLVTSDTEDSDDELNEADLNFGNKDTCILEVDDIEDVEIIASLMERCPPDGFHVVNTQIVPGLLELEAVKNLQLFTQVWRAKFPVTQCNINFSKHFQRILQNIYYKLRRMTPCAICDLKYRLNFPETDEIQLLVTGMALGLAEPKIINIKRKALAAVNNKLEDELIFNLEEDITTTTPTIDSSKPQLPIFTITTLKHSQSLKNKSTSENDDENAARLMKHIAFKERYGVDITPLGYIPGGNIERYLGNLNFFFIRESTSIRENGGISGFVHSFITELLAIVRSHVIALNGNALVAFYLTELILVDNPHKNQGQCIISVGGDVVHVSYKNDD